MRNRTKPVAPKKTRTKPVAPKKKAKSDSDDGGVVALSGFLYQILGFAGLKALAASADGEMVGRLAPEVLVSLVREGNSISYEGFGQDASVQKTVPDSKDEITLIQFKYSRDGITLKPKQFREVIKQLLLAGERVVTQGKSVGKSFLVTNRPLSPGVETIRKQKTALGWTQAEKTLLNSIDLSVTMEPQNWRTGLEKFGATYGLTPAEIGVGIERLVGYVTTSAVGQNTCTLDLATLANCLCSRWDSHSLDRKVLHSQITAKLATFHDHPSGKLVRRSVLREAERLHPDRALIVFAGRGGTGKTASLYHWAEEQTQAPRHQLAAFRDAYDLPSNWLSDLLHEWSRGFAETTTNEATLQRLEVANPDATPPLLHLSLDGLDEWSLDGSGTGNVRRLLKWFWELDCARLTTSKSVPRARLVVTCRDEAEFFSRWLPLERSGFGLSQTSRPPTLPFDEFSDEEFAELLSANVPQWSSRILRSLPNQRVTAPAADTMVLGMNANGTRCDVSVATALKDPSLWRAFLDLPDDQKEQALAGDSAAKRELGTVFVNRFCTKVYRRRQLTQPVTRAALMAIARAHRGQSQQLLARLEWIEPAVTDRACDESEAKLLWEEARSGGLINEISGKWQWRNILIEESLIGEAGEEGTDE